jgi:hypothetical protein
VVNAKGATNVTCNKPGSGLVNTGSISDSFRKVSIVCPGTDCLVAGRTVSDSSDQRYFGSEKFMSTTRIEYMNIFLEMKVSTR